MLNKLTENELTLLSCLVLAKTTETMQSKSNKKGPEKCYEVSLKEVERGSEEDERDARLGVLMKNW